MSAASVPPDGLRDAFEGAVYEVALQDGPKEFRTGPYGVATAPFVIISGWNPGGAELCLDENVARDAGLKAAIRARGWRWLAAENRASDETHVEPGYAIFEVPVGEVAAMAAQFGQLAVFAWDGRIGRIVWLDSYGVEPSR